MVGCARRFATRAIAAQVGGDDGEPLGQRRRDPVPHQVRLRDAVQKQDRLPGPTPDAMDCGLRRRDVELIETLEHRGNATHRSRRVPTGRPLANTAVVGRACSGSRVDGA
jgi:hypothetical protein